MAEQERETWQGLTSYKSKGERAYGKVPPFTNTRAKRERGGELVATRFHAERERERETSSNLLSFPSLTTRVEREIAGLLNFFEFT